MLGSNLLRTKKNVQRLLIDLSHNKFYFLLKLL